MSKQVELLEIIVHKLERIEKILLRIEEVLSKEPVQWRGSIMGQPIVSRREIPESAIGQPITGKEVGSLTGLGGFKLTPSEREVLEFLRKRGETTALDVAREFRISRSLATRYLRQLEKLGFAEKEYKKEGKTSVAVYKAVRRGVR